MSAVAVPSRRWRLLLLRVVVFIARVVSHGLVEAIVRAWVRVSSAGLADFISKSHVCVFVWISKKVFAKKKGTLIAR